MCEYRSRGNHAGPSRQRPCERFIAVIRSPIDQQEIKRDDFRLQPRDRIDNPGKIDSRKRITAALLDQGVVDRDDGDNVGRNSHAASQGSKIGHGRFDAIEKTQVTSLV